MKKRNRKKTHRIWNKYHPENPKIKNDGYCIHHKDKDCSNDEISNLEKITKAEHNRLHFTGEDNYMYGRKGKEHPCFGKICSKETRRKISEANKGKFSGNKNPFFGRKHSPETCEKLSKNMIGKLIGEKNPMYGKNHSEETKRKISEAKKGKFIGEKNHRFGKLQTKEAKEKIAAARIKTTMAEYHIFFSVTYAAKCLNTDRKTIKKRIEQHIPGYFYIK